MFEKKIKVVTHNGNFHADDVFACAALCLWAEKNNKKLKIIRSRDSKTIEEADIVVDVGGFCDADKNRFDHHQKNENRHENGVLFAAFGLVWQKFGLQICGDEKISERIEKTLVLPIDARDNGINISQTNELEIRDYPLSDVICDFNRTLEEDDKTDDKQFEKVLLLAKEILLREIVWAKSLVFGEKETERIIKEQNEPEILILEKKIEWEEAVTKNKKVKIIIYHREVENEWGLQVARDNLEDYNSNRIKFPKEWWGLRDGILEKVTGVSGAVFCAKDGWITSCKTKEGAIKMAEITLRKGEN